jgi:hypothetical protein
MDRKKLNLQWVSNNARRRATFNKRRQGLIKKTSELAMLCSIKVCILVYGDKAQLEVCPPPPHSEGQEPSHQLQGHDGSSTMEQ